MSTGYVISVDPAQLANRSIPWQDPLEAVEQEIETDDLLDPSYEAQIVPLLPRIPPREADLIEMYFLQKKRQADIAHIFGVTQAAISYRLDRGIQRIKFLLSIPRVTEEDLRSILPDAFPKSPIDVDILVGMWATTCQSEVAEKLGLTQGRVRHRFFRAVHTLEIKAKEDVRFEPYSRVFKAIASKKFNILREVKLPQWAGRGGDECL
jgi:DNA-directed RNA polymerase specialized sigma24 family protein